MSFERTISNVETFSEVIGACANSLLIYLALRHSSSNLGTYRYLTVIFGVNNIFNIVVHSLLKEKFFIDGRIFAIITIGTLSHIKYATPFYCSVFSIVLPIIDIHFLYRFISVRFPHRIHIFNLPTFIAMLAGVVGFLTSAWFTMCVFIFYETEPGLSRVAELAWQKFGLHKETIRLGTVVMADYEIGGSLNWTPVFGYIGFLLIISGSFVFMTTLGLLTYHTLDKSLMISPNSKRLQLNLLIVLTVQSIDPIVLYHLPSSAVLTFPLVGIHAPILGDCCSAIFALYPMTDGLVVIMMMADYRNALIKALERLLIRLRIRKPNAVTPPSVFMTSVMSSYV